MKKAIAVLIGAAVLAMPVRGNSPAWAGGVDIPEVRVGSNWATGSRVGARYSNDSTQYIQCKHRGFESYAQDIICSARDKSGKVLTCVNYGSKWSTAVQAMTDTSLIKFQVDSGGRCTSVSIGNHSFLVP